jgi:hypothetical protein
MTFDYSEIRKYALRFDKENFRRELLGFIENKITHPLAPSLVRRGNRKRS